NNGNVEVQPFSFNVKGINVNVAGSHGFDMNMNYNLSLDVPARLLGSQIGNVLGSLSGEDLQTMMVAVPIGLRGQSQNPQININMEQAVAGLTQQIVAKQKAKLEQKGVDAIRDILTKGAPRPVTTPADSTVRRDTLATPPVTRTNETQIKDAARNILGGLLKGNKKPADTTRNN